MAHTSSERTARLPANTALTCCEGLLVGGSHGTVSTAATVDDWLCAHGFAAPARPAPGVLLGDAVVALRAQLPVLVHTRPDETVRDALATMTEFGVSQLPVLTAEPPVTLAEVVGTVTAPQLREAAATGRASQPVRDVMAPRLAAAGTAEAAAVVAERAGKSGAVLVLDRGRPVGILTAADVTSLLGTGH